MWYVDCTTRMGGKVGYLSPRTTKNKVTVMMKWAGNEVRILLSKDGSLTDR